MNLQENIHRIQSMMGVITEDNRPNVFKKMIDDLGALTAIKMVGDYDLVMKHITEEDKIIFIKEMVKSLNGEYDGQGIRLAEFNIYPILFADGHNQHSYIEYIVPDGVFVDVYSKEPERYIKDYEIPYQKLDKEILDELFKELISIL
jgi:hypothetical protein